MLIKWLANGALYDLCDGPQRGVDKRVGPSAFSAPCIILGDDQPTIDAAWITPTTRGNRSNRVNFTASVECASTGAALALASNCKKIPASGILLTVDAITGEMVVYLDATLRTIDPVVRGVSCDIAYQFATGEDIAIGAKPAAPAVTGEPSAASVALNWPPVLGATGYKIYLQDGAELTLLETSDDPFLGGIIIPAAAEETYHVQALGVLADSDLSAPVTVAPL